MPVYRILMSLPADARFEYERAGEVIKRVAEDYNGEVEVELSCLPDSWHSAGRFAVNVTNSFDLVVCMIGEQTPTEKSTTEGAPFPFLLASEETAGGHTAQLGHIPDFVIFARDSENINEGLAENTDQIDFKWKALERFLHDWNRYGVNRRGSFTTSVNRYRNINEFAETFESLLRQKFQQRFAQPITEYLFPRGEALTQADHFFQRFGDRLAMDIRYYVYDWLWQIRIQGRKERRFVAKTVFSISGAFIAAAVLGSISFHRYRHFEDARRIAVIEKTEAQRVTRQAVTARFRAESMIHQVVADIGNNLSPVRRMDLLDGALRGIESYNQETGREVGDRTISVLRVAALDDQAELLRDDGKLAEALNSRREACDIIRRFIKENGEQTRWSDHLAQELQTIGDIEVSLKKVEPAISAYKEATDALERLLEQNPESAQLKTRLVALLGKIGNSYYTEKEWPAAIEWYEKQRRVVQTVIEKNATESNQWVLLSDIFNRLGQIYVNAGLPSQATGSYKGELGAAKRLAELNSGDQRLRLNVLACLERTGYALEVEGKLSEALDYYNEQLVMVRKLVSEDPANNGLERDVSISLDHIGGVWRVQGRPETAVKYYEQSLEVAQRIADADPSNRDRQRDVAFGLTNLGSVLADLDRPEDALKTSERGRAIFQKLCAEEPDKLAYQSDLAICLGRLGDLLKVDGQLDKALEYYASSLQICQRLAQSDPTNSLWRQDFALALQRVGESFIALEKLEDGLKDYRESCEIFERLLESNRTNPAWQEFLANGYLQCAKILRQQDKNAEIGPTLVRCRQMLRDLQGSEQLDDFGVSLLGETEQLLVKR
jgi:tetratricopeptide (TPR) repeat protein